MLNRTLARAFKETQHLKIWEQPGQYSMSGLSVTLFGATGFLGNEVARQLGLIGSDLVCPSKDRMWYNDSVKYLRLCAPVGYVYINHNTNFKDPHTIRRLIEKSNVVVNCAGPRKRYIRPERFREVNVELAARVARQARQAGVKRLIHFSSVGVDPRSPSLNLSTKWEGEQRVLDEFPDATIFRLSTTVGADDYFTRIFRIQSSWFNQFVPVYSDLTAKRQPILAGDVANCVIEALKQTDTRGQIFELGGPHVYTLKDIYDAMTHALKRPISYARISPSLALRVSNYISYEHFNAEDIKLESVDLVVNAKDGVKTVADLRYRPASVMPHIDFDVGRWGETPFITKNDSQL